MAGRGRGVVESEVVTLPIAVCKREGAINTFFMSFYQVVTLPTALCKGEGAINTFFMSFYQGEGAINTFFMFMGMGIISNKEVPLPDELY